ncbi:hypothetical protein T12_12826 [Trichinella patagoniensis]|uniref:Uncharacterized protein n=1 Tax=Trichinella patagoniensis TaxID=990121 RepID=A0A0V0ZPJ9_9BILA|nr:hypothetical protein T12_12826 [Trichinella patagoniensis]
MMHGVKKSSTPLDMVTNKKANSTLIVSMKKYNSIMTLRVSEDLPTGKPDKIGRLSLCSTMNESINHLVS